MRFRFALALIACLVSACRDEPEALAPEPLLWEIVVGEEWIYDVTASYPSGVTPRKWSQDEVLEEKNGRVILTFQRETLYRGKERVKAGKGEWDVMQHLRGGKVEDYEYLEITPEHVAFWGSKIEGDSPKPVVNLSTPMDLLRKGMTGGDRWRYALGSDEKGENHRTFRVMGEEEVIVPAGRCRATRIVVEGRSRDLDVKEVYWFSEEHGFVKIVKTFYSAEVIFKEEVMELRAKALRFW